MYKLGDKVWYAQMKNVEKKETCPECFGKKYLTVILGDNSKVTIDCAGCGGGFDYAKGYVTYYQWETDVQEVTIERIEISSKGVEYGFHSCYIARDAKIFSTEKEAEVKAKELAEEHNKEELKKLSRKEKNNHTWSWNVHYYRKEIRNSKENIERYEKLLNVAKSVEGDKL